MYKWPKNLLKDAIKEMQTKTTTRYHYTHTKDGSNENDNNERWQRCGEIRTLIFYIAGENVKMV